MSNARKLVLLAVAVLLVGGLVYFLSGRGNETGTAPAEQTSPASASLTISTSPAPATTDVTADPDTEAAENIARQALSVAFTWYPATDRSPTDGYMRAREWFTDPLAQTLLVDTHTERGPGAQWNQWASGNAKVVADVTLGCSGCPPRHRRPHPPSRQHPPNRNHRKPNQHCHTRYHGLGDPHQRW